MWLSYLTLEAGAGDLDYDLAVSAEPDREPSIDDAGVGPAAVVPISLPDAGPALWPLVVAVGAATVVIVGMVNGRPTTDDRRTLSHSAPAP